MGTVACSTLREFLVGRGRQVEFTIYAATQGGNPSGKDISNARWSVEFRAWQDGADGTFLRQVVLTKQTTTASAGDGGVASGYIPGFTAAYSLIHCEVVLIDANTADASTPSGDAEYHLEGSPWDAAVVDTATS